MIDLSKLITAEEKFEQAKRDKLAEINRAYTQAVQTLGADYPEDEQKSWPVQIMEARELVANPDADTPWIDAAASDRGITREALADLIIAQDTAYRVIHGGLSGTRQRLRDEIDAAESPGDLEQITWPH